MLYRNWRYEQELDSLLWKVDFKEIQMHENDKENSSQKQTRVSYFLFFFITFLLRTTIYQRNIVVSVRNIVLYTMVVYHIIYIFILFKELQTLQIKFKSKKNIIVVHCTTIQLIRSCLAVQFVLLYFIICFWNFICT